jgi:hypothetical protein
MGDVREDGFPGGIGRWTSGDAGLKTPEASMTKQAAAEVEISEVDRELDAEAASRAAELKRLGASDEEIERHAGKSAAQRAVSLASVERELAEVTAKMKTARGAEYNQLDKRQLELIEALQAKSEMATPAQEPEADDGDGEEEPGETTAAESRLAKIDDELTAIAEKRATVKGAERDKLDERERELLQERMVFEVGTYIGEDVAGEMVGYLEAHGGVAEGMGVLAGLVKGSEAGAETWADFDAMPKGVRVVVMQHALAHNGSMRRLEESIEKALTGSDLQAYKAWRDRHGQTIRAGLVR